MPTREQTINDAVQVFESATYPSGLTEETAWLGIYQALLWYEPINWLGFIDLPHIIDADKLRPSSLAKQRTWKKPRAWQRRAESLNVYLAEQLGCPVNSVVDMTDRLMKLPDYEGMQRHNTLGIAFPGIVKHIIENFGSEVVSYDIEIPAERIFPGVTFPGRSVTPRIDLLARRDNIPKAIITSKWSVRHDRVSDLTNECPVYKAAYERIYRQEHPDHLLYYVLTNEYDPSRLNKMMDDACIDGVVHVHKAAVVEVCQLDDRVTRLLDLADLINETFNW